MRSHESHGSLSHGSHGHTRTLLWLTFLSIVAAGATAALVQARSTPPDVDVKIDEWMTPSKPPYPHDPAVAPDGAVWYTGQRANVVGRFDPKTELFKEWSLPTQNSGPHGLTFDKNGHCWYTGNAAGLIGEIDPQTDHIREYKMPDPNARDPHTPIFDRRGILWFTVQAGS